MNTKIFYSSIIIILITFGLSSCKKSEKDYKADKYLTSSQQDTLLTNIVTIVEEHYPDSIKKEERFDKQYRAFYIDQLRLYDYVYLYKNDQGVYYYFIEKPARGAKHLTVGMAGKFKVDANLKISDFEESYRLNRMPPNELDKRGWEVYQTFVADKDLTPFKTKDEKYIEFPNDNVGYDKKKLEWYLIKPYGNAN